MSNELEPGTPEFAQRLTELSTVDLLFAYKREDDGYRKDSVSILLIGEARRRDGEMAALKARVPDAAPVVVPSEIREAIQYMASTYWLAHAGPNKTYEMVMAWLKEHERGTDGNNID